MFIGFNGSHFKSDSHLSDPQKRYDRDLEKAKRQSWKCPCCGSLSKMKAHCSYERKIHAGTNHAGTVLWITVFRCPCKTCTHPYHAFLPGWICPFSIFTYPFIAAVLGFFYTDGNEKISTTARKFNISRTSVRKLVKRFSQEDWLVQQTSLAQKQGHSRKNVALQISASSTILEKFLSNFLFVNQTAFFTRHFSPQSRWAFIAYRLCLI